MKLATRIKFGYVLLIVLFAGAGAYQISLTHRMQQITRQLAETSFQAARSSLELWRLLQQVDEFTRKFLGLRDWEYGREAQEWRHSCTRTLSLLEDLSLSPPEERAFRKLKGLWEEFETRSEEWEALLRQSGQASQYQQATSQLLPLLEDVMGGTEALILATQDQIRRQGEISYRTAVRAEWIALITVLLALLAGSLTSLLLVRSISRPLFNLSQATRRLSRGDFDFQVPEEGDVELAQVARGFNTMVRRLGELDRLKKDFVSHVSHELKAPLAAMQETNSLLMEEIPCPLSPDQKRLIELNQQCARRLSLMIRNLLDLSRLEAGMMRYDFALHDLRSILKRGVEELRGLAGEKNLRIELALPPQPLPARCDQELIQQVVANLFSNAVKFSPPGGVIHLGARSVNSASLQFWVQDQGPGVPKEQKERIFEKFQRVRVGRKLAGQGTGLGLAISRRIVGEHKGRLWVEDVSGGGARFIVELPLAPQGSVSRPADADAAADQSP